MRGIAITRTWYQERGLLFEKEVANLLNGKLTPGSGNKFYAKNDITAGGLSISAKSQKEFSWSQIKRYLDQSIDDSIGSGNIPVLALDDDGDKEQYIVMRLSDLAKAFKDEIKLDSKSKSKGIQKRETAEVPLMLR
jgi:hypothetical protein